MEKFFIYKTNRMPKKDNLSVNIINELLLFICVYMWISDVNYFSSATISDDNRIEN